MKKIGDGDEMRSLCCIYTSTHKKKRTSHVVISYFSNNSLTSTLLVQFDPSQMIISRDKIEFYDENKILGVNDSIGPWNKNYSFLMLN